DAFVAKLSASGSTLLFSTFLGGSGFEEGYGIALDASGNAYVTGITGSTNFPTASPLQSTFSGLRDAFVANLCPECTGGPSASNNGRSILGIPTTLQATVAGGTNVSYNWAFGDGIVGSGATVLHTYTQPGSYTAVVTASNSVSTAVATTTVQADILI